MGGGPSLAPLNLPSLVHWDGAGGQGPQPADIESGGDVDLDILAEVLAFSWRIVGRVGLFFE